MVHVSSAHAMQMTDLNSDNTHKVSHLTNFRSDNGRASSLDPQWMENVRLGTLRLPKCAGALVSADGLAVTSASCLRSLESWIRPGDTLFIAKDMSSEIRLSGLTIGQLIDLRKINHVEEASNNGASLIETELIAAPDSSYFWEYVWRIYDDVRLVLIPPTEIANFGNEDGVYPRYAMDFALLRLYDQDSQPLDTESYFAWNDRPPLIREELFVTTVGDQMPSTQVTLSNTFSYNGTTAPPFTTLYGMLDLHSSHGETTDWGLSSQWMSLIQESDLSAVLNFSLLGECPNMGAAVIDIDMEILGITFDDADSEEGPRCVAMSTSGILSILQGILNAQELAEELAQQMHGGQDE
ncbi:MAG: S46 family peptidase [Bacteroidetes bacterium]|nr:S46 family peptidase [Bacteroidota bacterium]